MKRIALSWSGGKDACLALDRLTSQGYEVAFLVTTVPSHEGKTFAHEEKVEFIQLQGEALGIPVRFVESEFKHYTERFVGALADLKEKERIEGIAFGDLYLQEHRDWGERVAEIAGLVPLYPLWMPKSQVKAALDELIESGYKAMVIKANEEKLDLSWLGRVIDVEFSRNIGKLEICPLGESGEYHTFVMDGPLFRKRIEVETGNVISHGNEKRLELTSGCLVHK
ncbi:diphthine--ammonia ligase [Mesobacillus harenae]|uniref:Dph6-related ATP pyrophosphatase n=1 Tax=Mesobacillus harenae TaxID=2213203 RepID=UPI001580C4B8|nr:diphthine--ammonia ligase [Mesobacillus harenae]